MRPLPFLTLATSLLALGSCADSSTDHPPLPADPGPPVDLTVRRFDEALHALDTTVLDAEAERALGAGAGAEGGSDNQEVPARGTLQNLVDEYGPFADIYFTHLVPIRRGDLSPSEQAAALAAFRRYPLTHGIDSIVAARFQDGEELTPLIEDFEEALTYYHYYLPRAGVPDSLTVYYSPFELAAFLYGDGELAVGLDFFLGPDFDYQAVNPNEEIFSDYLTRTYTPEHFTTKLLRVLLDDYAPRPRAGRLLDYLVSEGKKLYLLRQLQPDVPAHVVFEVTPEQMEWLEGNESEIYFYLQEEDALYTTDTQRIRKYTQPAPTSQGMPRESPGGAVNYLGYRIVADYLENNPEVTIGQLFAEGDGQRVLAGARFKPR